MFFRLKSAASLDEISESESGAAGSGIVPVTPQSVKAATPLENVTTPLSANSRDPSSQEEVVHEVGGSVSSSDIFSPSAPKAKKRFVSFCIDLEMIHSSFIIW